LIPSEWKDKNGYLISRPGVNNEDNGILFSAYYYQISKQASDANAIKPLINSFYNLPNFLSHDNITGWLVLSKLCGNSFKMKEDWWTKYLHPRDIAFYYTLKGNKGLTWIVKLATKVSLNQPIKYRHNIQYTIPESERSFLDNLKVRLTPILPFLFKDKRGIEDSSGKILAWLRCHALGLDDWWKKQDVDIKRYFNMYFNDQENHPVIEVMNDRDI